MMRIFTAVFFTAVLVEHTFLSAEEISGYDRFSLWNNCQGVYPYYMLVGVSEDDSKRIKTGVEIQLEDAGIDTIEYPSKLNVSVTPFARETIHEVELALNLPMVNYWDLSERSSKLKKGEGVWDLIPRAHVDFLAVLLEVDHVVHDGDTTKIIRSVTKLTDNFINRYLRVNAEACE